MCVAKDLLNMNVYLVGGSIEDGMQGIPFTLGIFSSEQSARNAIINRIGIAKYTTDDNIRYSVEDDRSYYYINISKYYLDEVDADQDIF